MRKMQVRRKAALGILLLLFLSYWLPCAVFAAEAMERNSTPPPEEPMEKVVFTQGDWHSEYLAYDSKVNLIVAYSGSRNIENDTSAAAEISKDGEWNEIGSFTLRKKTLLRGVYIPYTYPAGKVPKENAKVLLKYEGGNIYGPYALKPSPVGKAKEITDFQKKAGEEGIALRMDEKAAEGIKADFLELDTVFIADSQITLTEGKYSLYATNGDGMVRNMTSDYKVPVLIKGVDYSAWKKYRAKYNQWAQEQYAQEGHEKSGDSGIKEGETAISVVGSQPLSIAVEKPEESYPVAVSVASAQRLPAIITLKESSVIEEIVFNTYNGGNGAPPGTISIVDANGSIMGSYQAAGGKLGGTPNGLWVAGPGIVLPAGEYSLTCSDMSVVGYLEGGAPDFYVTAAPAPPPLFDFTGRYFIDLSVSKTSTLMGAVSGDKPSFSLKSFELTVLDRGERLEIIGKYEGMPFSQVCKVTSREEKKLEAAFSFGADLTQLPYRAKIGANCVINLAKGPIAPPSVEIRGKGTYDRKASKDKGADYNTYDITAKGSQADTILPGYVAAALGARVPAAGNIPGPASPAQAAVGALFPPLVGLVVQVVQSLIKRKTEEEEASTPKHKLSVGEQAMADANKSLGKGLYDEKEAKAWATLADALGNSDEPDDDPFSIGDNEKPGGADYKAPAGGDSHGEDDGYGDSGQENSSYEEEPSQENSGYSEPAAPEKVFGSEKEKLEAERDEWLKNLKDSQASADPSDPRSDELHKTYQDYIDSLNDRIQKLGAAEKSAGSMSMTVQVDHTGRTAEIQYDPERGTWVNIESGNDFDMEKYHKDVAPNFAKDREFIKEQRSKLETRSTEFDKAMDTLVAENKSRQQLLVQLQKIRNQSFGITPPAEGVGDVSANIDKLITQLSNRGIPVDQIRDRAGRVAKVIVDCNTGVTMSEEAGKKLAEGEMSYTKAVAVTITEGAIDVATGRTWAGIAGRAAIAVATGGASEYVMSPAEALINIKNDIDKGQSGGKAVINAIGSYVLGEVGGKALGSLGGKAMGKAWEKIGGSIDPNTVKKLSDLGNTPISKLLGTGTKTGAKEAMEAASSGTGKYVAGAAKESMGKTASDTLEYSKYMTSVKNQASVIDGKIRAGENLSVDDIRKVLRDPSVPRELKNSHIDVQSKFKDVLDEKLYTPSKENTAKALKDVLSKDLEPGSRIIGVEVESIRTPGAKASPINADNDLTGKITIIDAKGRTIVKEIPAEKVAPIYNEKFAEAAGMMKDGKFDVAKARAEMPEGVTITDARGNKQTIPWEKATKEQQLEAFAGKHNQEVTDKLSAEAAVDFNSSNKASGKSNVGELKDAVAGAKLDDPAGLAKMEEYKVNNYFNKCTGDIKADLANQKEAYEQLAKMGKLTGDLTSAYQKLGYSPQAMPAEMKKAMEVIADSRLSPGNKTLKLQELGFSGPQELAGKLSSRIEGLEKLKTAASGNAGGEGNNLINKATSSIIKSYLNDYDK